LEKNTALSRKIRSDILRMSHASGHGHIPTSFSIVESLVAVYGTIRHDPNRPDWPGRDIFILSKGHGSLALYCTLAAFGYFDVEEVAGFGGYGGRFGCHADRTKVQGVEASTGSLGHGIGLAVGAALGAKILKRDQRVVTLIGDGEANEGSVWEAVMVAADQKLSNLTIIYDDNKSQTRCLELADPAARFSAFGCETVIVDGHDVDALSAALSEPSATVKVIVADTRKGYGARTLLDDMFAWHRRSPNAEELERLLEEVNATPV
jgi:transketolase